MIHSSMLNKIVAKNIPPVYVITDNIEKLFDYYKDTLLDFSDTILASNNSLDLLISCFVPKNKDIYSRLIELRKLEQEDESIEMSFDSLNTFYSFILENPKIKIPAIVESEAGNIYIEWFKKDQYLIGVEFLKNDYISFTILLQSEKSDPLVQSSNFGIDSVYKFSSLVASNNLHSVIHENA